MMTSGDVFFVYGENEFREEFGDLSPSQFIDLQSLMGDASDNIPGIRGVGPKSALNWIIAHGDMEGVFEAADRGELKPKKFNEVLQSGGTGREDALLSRKLVTIAQDLLMPDLTMPIDDYKWSAPADGGVAAFRLLSDLEMGTMVKEFATLWSDHFGVHTDIDRVLSETQLKVIERETSREDFQV